jgi:hypothetical protein
MFGFLLSLALGALVVLFITDIGANVLLAVIDAVTPPVP